MGCRLLKASAFYILAGSSFLPVKTETRSIRVGFLFQGGARGIPFFKRRTTTLGRFFRLTSNTATQGVNGGIFGTFMRDFPRGLLTNLGGMW
jgi:hypothetical protein